LSACDGLTVGGGNRDVWKKSFGSSGIGGKGGDIEGSMEDIAFLL
jgi:hypothetical protein